MTRFRKIQKKVNFIGKFHKNISLGLKISMLSNTRSEITNCFAIAGQIANLTRVLINNVASHRIKLRDVSLLFFQSGRFVTSFVALPG